MSLPDTLSIACWVAGIVLFGLWPISTAIGRLADAHAAALEWDKRKYWWSQNEPDEELTPGGFPVSEVTRR
ncbi:MAG: hypothetical protein ACYC6M_03050 [Terriglobales bacterium]